MKLEIINSEDGMNTWWIKIDNLIISNNLRGVTPKKFIESDIEKLLGDKRFKKFLNGKYKFNLEKYTYEEFFEYLIDKVKEDKNGE
jgi:hypothetical protein